MIDINTIDVVIATTEYSTAIADIERVCFVHPWSEQNIIDSINNDNTSLYLALVDGNVAGYMGLQIFSGEGYVTNVATLPQYRKMGVAKALVKHAMQNDMEFITLEVRPSNTPAINLYKQFGFEEVGRRPRFYRDPTEDALLMTKYF